MTKDKWLVKTVWDHCGENRLEEMLGQCRGMWAL